MKTSIDIPESILADALRLSGASTKREAVVTALDDFVKRKKMAELTKLAGSCDQLLTSEELKALRHK